MEKRFNIIKEKFPSATMTISNNSCKGDFFVDISGKEYSLKSCDINILQEEYIKEITNIINERDNNFINQIKEISMKYLWVTKD